MYNKNNLDEVYFPIQRDSSLHSYAAEDKGYVEYIKSSIIKVGSFYDYTKNNFPDEFDFIFPLFAARTIIRISFLKLGEHVSKAIVEYGKSLHYPALCEERQVTRKLDFKTCIGIHGPALKIQFIYSNGFGELRPIHVDLVPAVKIIDTNTQPWFVEWVREDVKPETFREEILSAESCLDVGRGLAFTETEQHFMKNILSEKHVKVTRIIKHLLNGNGDGETLEEYLKRPFSDKGTYYSSYCIKILMIHHHEACKNTDTEDLGPCVLQVLKEITKYQHNHDFHWFTSNIAGERVFRVLPYLKYTIRTLQSMQTSEDNYDYDKDKIQSVSGQCLDALHIRDQNEHTQSKRRCVIL